MKTYKDITEFGPGGGRSFRCRSVFVVCNGKLWRI